MSKVWSYGLTTVPGRYITTLGPTLLSLQEAGFAKPRVFVDGSTPFPTALKHLVSGVVYRGTNIKTVGNWILTAWEIYLREPNADFYAIFQDDFITYRNLRGYIEASELPIDGYLNLYTFPENQELISKRKNTLGWCESNQRGLGAVALVFPQHIMTKLLSSPHLVKKPKHPKRNTSSIDGAIVESMHRLNLLEYVHNPSLVQHTGVESSMGNKKHPLAISFLGENYDATHLLKGAPVIAPIPSKPQGVYADTVSGLEPSSDSPQEEQTVPTPKIGIVGHAMPDRLGQLCQQAVKKLEVTNWLVVPGGAAPPPSIAIFACRGEVGKLRAFCNQLDVLVFFDSPVFNSLPQVCIETSTRTICVLTKDRDIPERSLDWLQKTSLVLCPTKECRDSLASRGVQAATLPWEDGSQFDQKLQSVVLGLLHVQDASESNEPENGTGSVENTTTLSGEPTARASLSEKRGND